MQFKVYEKEGERELEMIRGQGSQSVANFPNTTLLHNSIFVPWLFYAQEGRSSYSSISSSITNLICCVNIPTFEQANLSCFLL